MDTFNGIILAGGASRRFGSCKSKMRFNNKSVLAQTYSLIDKYCEKVLVSCREESKKVEGYDCLYDLYQVYAPIAGIYSALVHFNTPVIVLSCDLAFIDKATIEELIDERNRAVQENPLVFMTCFELHNKKKADQGKSLEPLVAIYEPRAMEALKTALDKEIYSLYRAIPSHVTHVIYTENTKPFFNINTVEELEEAEQLMF